MTEREGVTKYHLHHHHDPHALLHHAARLTTLIHFRQQLALEGVIGQDPDRYDGVGFGNLSARLPSPHRPGHIPFIITGTQTGAIHTLTPQHFGLVTACDALTNQITSTGPWRPSSEALTHGAVYDLDDAIQWVFHGHAPTLWRAARHLGLPTTPPHVAYGTPAMAQAVAQLWAHTPLPSTRLFAMGGHEDGVVAFGHNPQDAADVLLHALHLARELPTSPPL